VRHDRGGDETWQLSVLEQGRLRRLTRDDKAIHQGATVSPDGRRVGLAYNPDGQVDFVLAVLDLKSGDLEEWLRPDGYWYWDAWRPDGSQAAAVRGLGSLRSNAFLIAPGGEPVPVLPAAKRVQSIRWTARGALIALTNFERDFVGIAELDPQRLDRPSRWLLAPEADVEAAVLDPLRKQAIVEVNRGANSELLKLDLESGEVTDRYDGLPKGTLYADNTSEPDQMVAWSLDDERAFVAWETPTLPSEIYELPAAERWTFAGQGFEGPVEPVETSYTSFDRLHVPALHFKVDDRPRPTVVWFHGGPESQLRGGYSPVFQMLLSAGFNVFAPNVRGSSGYGARYAELDDRELRWDSVRDGCEAGRHLKREGMATRLAAMGGSYGGFMTLAVLVEDPDLWDAAVDIVGIADWHSFFKNTSGWRRAIRASEYGDPERQPDAEFLAQFSPLRRAHLIKAPVLVIHGRNDVRVPVGEAEQISKAAPHSELMIFDDEGHGLVRHPNRVRAYGRALAFLSERLGRSTSA
jgi:dipeptidyl aminopeptidase/acylaminoacyl peptidase